MTVPVEIERAARWLADIHPTPENPVDIVIKRFALRTWQARKAVEHARVMKMLRSAHS